MEQKEKDFLVDVPVMLYVFVRPQTLRKVFEVIKKARPSKLFLISDGPRENIKSDKENIKLSRKIVEDIDWNCDVNKLYFEKNMGMYKTGELAKKFVYEKVDRCIHLEDDVVVSVSFFKYCEELLEKYKNDLRIHYITGMNYLEEYKETEKDYFFSTQGSIWGFATWKRTIEQQNHNYRGDVYIEKRMKELMKVDKKDILKRFIGYSKRDIFDKHQAGVEYYKELLKYTQNQLYIIPTKNMVSNIGVGASSSHSPDNINKLPKSVQKLFNMKIFEINFPLNHPDYVIKDLNYEKKVFKMLGCKNSLALFIKKIERLARYIYYGDFKRIRMIIQKKISKNIEK